MKDKTGRIAYQKDENNWVIVAASTPVTYDGQDRGIVCNDLPEEFKHYRDDGSIQRCV